MADGGSGEREPAAGGSRVRKFVTSLPGAVAGLATVVTAVATIAGVFSHDDSPPPRSAPPATTAPVTTPAPATAAPATPGPSRAGAATGGQPGYRLLWGPKELLVTNEGTDLSDVPPVSDNGGDSDLYDDERGFGPMSGAKLAVWHGSSAPTPAQCTDLVRSGSSAAGVDTNPGSVVCAETGQGVVASLRVVSKDSEALTTRTVTTIWAPR